MVEQADRLPLEALVEQADLQVLPLVEQEDRLPLEALMEQADLQVLPLVALVGP